jgi:hypothetical protein
MRAIAKFEKLTACGFRVFRSNWSGKTYYGAQEDSIKMADIMFSEKRGCQLQLLKIDHFWTDWTEQTQQSSHLNWTVRPVRYLESSYTQSTIQDLVSRRSMALAPVPAEGALRNVRLDSSRATIMVNGRRIPVAVPFIASVPSNNS